MVALTDLVASMLERILLWKVRSFSSSDNVPDGYIASRLEEEEDQSNYCVNAAVIVQIDVASTCTPPPRWALISLRTIAVVGFRPPSRYSIF